MITPFTTLQVAPELCYSAMFYRAKNKLNTGARIKPDLTKSRYGLLKRMNDHVEEVSFMKFCYADINCRLMVKFNKEKTGRTMFSPLSYI